MVVGLAMEGRRGVEATQRRVKQDASTRDSLPVFFGTALSITTV